MTLCFPMNSTEYYNWSATLWKGTLIFATNKSRIHVQIWHIRVDGSSLLVFRQCITWIPFLHTISCFLTLASVKYNGSQTFLFRITHVAESGDDGSTNVDDIMLLKVLHVNRKALITVMNGMSCLIHVFESKCGILVFLFVFRRYCLSMIYLLDIHVFMSVSCK